MTGMSLLMIADVNRTNTIQCATLHLVVSRKAIRSINPMRNYSVIIVIASEFFIINLSIYRILISCNDCTVQTIRNKCETNALGFCIRKTMTSKCIQCPHTLRCSNHAVRKCFTEKQLKNRQQSDEMGVPSAFQLIVNNAHYASAIAVRTTLRRNQLTVTCE